MKKNDKTKRCEHCGKIIESDYPTQLDWNFKIHQKYCKFKINGEHAVADKNLSAIAKTKTKSAIQTRANKINEEIRKEY